MAKRTKKPHVYPVPKNFGDIKKLRSSEKFKVTSCDFLKEETELRGYQHIGALNMTLCNRMILGDDPGLGKTLQALTAFGLAKKHNPDLKLWVITTRSAMEQWGQEVDKFMVGINYHVLKEKYKPEGATRQLTGTKGRHAQYEEIKNVDVFVTGYYPLQVEPDLLAEMFGQNVMIAFDEVQAVKNHKSKTHLGAVIVTAGVKRVYGLTATPIKNKLLEFYYIFKVIHPKLFDLVTKWKKEFCEQEMKRIPKKGGGHMITMEVTGYKNLDRFREVIEPYFLRRSAEEVAKDLPGIVSRKIENEMTAAQKKLYQEAIAGIVTERKVRQKFFDVKEKIEDLEMAGKEIPEKVEKQFDVLEEKYEEILSGDFLKNNKAATLGFLQLVANGPQWLGPEEEGKSSKEEDFKELLEGELYGSKMIVFTRFISGIPRLEEIADKLGIKHVRVTGDEKGTQRTKARELFQDNDSGYDIIFITMAGSAAINLQASGVMVFYDSPWSWGDLVQIIGRARRIGSVHKNVMVYHFIARETIDDRVIEVLTVKKDLNEDILGKQASGAIEFGEAPVITEEDKERMRDRNEVDILFDDIFVDT